MDKDKHSMEREERLNRYVEALHAEKTTADFEIRNVEEARLWRIARALKVAAHPEKSVPRPTFAAELERRLLARQRPSTQTKTWPSWWERVRVGFFAHRRATAGAMLLLAVLLLLVGAPVVEWLNPPLPLLPSLVTVVQAHGSLEGLPSLPGLLGDVSFDLETPLPAVPEQVTIYQQRPAPIIPREVEVLAHRFAIQGAVHRVGESLVVEDDSQRLVIYGNQKGYYHYRRLRVPSPPHGASIDGVEAAQRAQAFLDQRGLLSFEHRAPVITQLPVGGRDTARHQVLFPQVVDGLAVENAGVKVTLDEAGEVLEVVGRVLHLTSVSRYPILSAEGAYRALQDQDPRRVFLVNVRQENVRAITHIVVREVEGPPTPSSPYHPGDHVAVEGMVSSALVYEDARGDVRYVQASLTTNVGASGYSYKLIGPKTVELARYHRLRLKVWGTVVTNSQGALAILVEDYQRSRPEEEFVTLLGQLIVEESEGKEQMLLLTDDGARYLLSWGQASQPIAEYRENEWLGRKVLMGGTLTGERSAEEYPILILAGFETGTEIETLQSAEERPWPRPPVVRDVFPTLSGQAVLEEATLRYFTLPVPLDPTNSAAAAALRYLLPVYRFQGYTTDGVAFTIYVQAVRDDYLP